MSEIDWGIIRSAGPVDIAGNFARGYDIADKIVTKTHERNALGYLAQNPDDQGALAQLYQADPAMGAHFEARAQQLAETKRRTALAQQYQTDPTGARQAAIGTGDFDLAEQFSNLDEATQKRAADFWEKAGPVAYRLKQTADPAQRQALWQQAKPILQSEGIDQAQLDKFDPTNEAQLDAAITTSQKMSDLIAQNKPEEFNVDPGAARYERDPVTHQIRTIIAPNPGGEQFGAPVSGGPSGGDSRGSRNSNPLNLTKSDFTASQPGYTGTDSGGRYATFATPAAGAAAGEQLLHSYISRGFDTPTEIINRWAPASENGAASTANYVQYVSQKVGLDPNETVTPDKLPALMAAMAEFESGGRKGGSQRVASVGGTPHVATKADFDKLPSGTPFIAPDGSRRVKP